MFYAPVVRNLASAVLVAMIAVIAVPSAALAEDPPPPPPTASRLGSPEIFGYLTYWDLYAQIDYEAITTIAYFGLAARADGTLGRYNTNGTKTTEYSRWQSARVNNVINEAHAHGVKFVLTVERMAWEDGTKATTRALLGSPTARTTLVNEIVAEIQLRGLDGVTLDFEPILSDTRDQFAALLAELRAALDAVNPAYQLTFAATGSAPSLTYQMFGNVTAAGWADAVLIMAYPLRGLGASVAGGLAPLHSPTSYDLKQITNAYLQYVAADKIVMLLPWYGRQWPTVSPDLNARVQTDQTLYDRPRNIGYASAIPFAVQHGRNFDPVEQSAWTVFRWRYCDTCPETWKQIYYDDVESLGYKYDWVLGKGMAGIGIWALGYDNDRPELWKLLRTRYGGLVDTSPPTGSIGLAEAPTPCAPSKVRLALSADDGTDGSGPVYVRVSNSDSMDGSGLLALSRTYPAAPQITWSLDDAAFGGSSATGPRTVYAQWRDVAGNWSPIASTSVEVGPSASAAVSVAGGSAFVTASSVDIEVDQTGGPTIARVLVSSSDAAIDGVLSQAVDIPLGSPTTFSVTDPATGGVDADGAHPILVQWQDGAGCWSAPVSSTVTLDRAAPAGSISLVDAPAVSVDGTEGVLAPGTDDGSGVARVELSNDGTSWQAFAPTAEAIDWSAGDRADGPWTIHARWTDAAGNVSATQTTSVLLDRAGPQGALLVNGGASTSTSADVTVEATATDSASQVTTVRLSNSADMTDGVLSAGVDFQPGAPIAWTLAGEDGMRSVHAQWRDAAGNWSSVVAAQLLLDRSAPLVTPPRTSLVTGSQLGLTSVPLAADWTASDPVSGLSTVSLEIARDTTAWTSVPHAAAAPTSASLTIDRSSTWRVRVSARDVAGNASAPAEGLPVRATVTEDSSSSAVYSGSWTRVRRSSASGGTIRYATARGATVTYRFTGRSIAWVAAVGPTLGRATVLIDGRAVATVDLKAAGQQRRLVFSRNFASAGTHTIKIRVLGTAGRPRVELDGFLVLS